MRRHLVTVDYGLSSIGDMGFFRRGSQAIGDEAIAWLEDVSKGD